MGYNQYNISRVNQKSNTRVGSIIISTYIKSVKGPISERVVNFYNSKNNNKVIVKIISKWCYLSDAKNRKITAIPEFISNLLTHLIQKLNNFLSFIISLTSLEILFKVDSS